MRRGRTITIIQYLLILSLCSLIITAYTVWLEALMEHVTSAVLEWLLFVIILGVLFGIRSEVIVRRGEAYTIFRDRHGRFVSSATQAFIRTLTLITVAAFLSLIVSFANYVVGTVISSLSFLERWGLITLILWCIFFYHLVSS